MNILSPLKNTVSLTHQGPDKLTLAEIADDLHTIKTRLDHQFKDNAETVDILLKKVDALADFELGRFLIKNKGALSGYWTWYVTVGFNHHTITSPLEQFILTKMPLALATQERFKITQKLLLQHIHSNHVVCSIPCGVMADLLTLNLSKNLRGVRYVGIDIDQDVFALAKNLSRQLTTNIACEFVCHDAWHLTQENVFDIITTNGLNIYEKDDNKVVALYRAFYNALKSNGRLICSALTCPPTVDNECEWSLSPTDKENLLPAAILFKTILESTWMNFRSSATTCAQLKEAGFNMIEIHWDSRKMFPTFCAIK